MAEITEKTKITLPVTSVITSVIAIVGATIYIVSMGATINAKVNSLESSMVNISQRFGAIEAKIERIGDDVTSARRTTDSRLATIEAKLGLK